MGAAVPWMSLVLDERLVEEEDADADDDNKPIRPTWAVGALFRRCEKKKTTLGWVCKKDATLDSRRN
jgi:hypothetical protein